MKSKYVGAILAVFVAALLLWAGIETAHDLSAWAVFGAMIAAEIAIAARYIKKQ